ncbi:outer membrane beta-barrel protein [Parerythrobacter aurantius]|uniref:outer membrane beta-barrel protein n=1 Tax=Parerythrobacter aurantius TaxID=3127706 RepID=UPI003254C1DD
MNTKLFKWRLFAGIAVCATCFSSTGVLAQATIAPLLVGDDTDYRLEAKTVGPVALRPQIIAAVTYDDNVIASPEGTEVSDIEVVLRPELNARVGDQKLSLQLNGFGEFSRFFDFSSENSDTYGANGLISFSPRVGDRLSLSAGYARLKENRGDPEARLLAGPGPRLTDETSAAIAYRRNEGPIQLNLEASFSDMDAVSPFDDDRDFQTFAGRATIGYRVSGPLSATVTGFVNSRDFRQEASLLVPDRDASTYGGQIGINIDESERLRGRLRLGIFRFDPQDPSIAARTGFSADASIAYLPTRRLAFVLEGFNGDVATFRQGAQSRTDSRIAFTTQFEMRHNVYGRIGARWLKSRFVGSGISEEIVGTNIGIEYLANRRLSLIAEASAAQRTSDDPSQEFERFRFSLSARFRF